jgi:hypothetical protein
MKTTKDDNGAITFPRNIFDKILLKILLKLFNFNYWLSRKKCYKKLYYKYLRKITKINFLMPFQQNSFDEASVNINKAIRDEAVKKRLLEMKEEMGEEELFKVLKKELSRKEYKRTMEDITRWKKKGIWI